MRYRDPVRLPVYCRQPHPNGCAETEQTEVGDTHVDALGRNVPPFGSHRYATSWRFFVSGKYLGEQVSVYTIATPPRPAPTCTPVSTKNFLHPLVKRGDRHIHPVLSFSSRSTYDHICVGSWSISRTTIGAGDPRRPFQYHGKTLPTPRCDELPLSAAPRHAYGCTTQRAALPCVRSPSILGAGWCAYPSNRVCVSIWAPLGSPDLTPYPCVGWRATGLGLSDPLPSLGCLLRGNFCKSVKWCPLKQGRPAHDVPRIDNPTPRRGWSLEAKLPRQRAAQETQICRHPFRCVTDPSWSLHVSRPATYHVTSRSSFTWRTCN